MEISDVEVLMYEFPIAEAWEEKPEWYRTFHNGMTGWENTVTARQECLVRLTTTDGMVGVGSADTAHKDPRVVAAIIENILEPVVVGEDPTDIERLWYEMRDACGSRLAGIRGLGYSAIGGINVACWDILGKQLGCPLYALLGGDEDIPVVPYIGTWTHGWREPSDLDSLVAEVEYYVEQGYEAVKIRGGQPDSTNDIKSVQAIRAEYDADELALMIDINEGYSRQEAADLIGEYEDFDMFWIEDPFETPDISDYAAFQEKTPIDIFIGGGPSSREFTQMVKQGTTTNLASLSTEHGGGVSEALKVAGLIENWNLTAAGIAHEPLGSIPLFHVWKAIPPRITKDSYVEYDPMNSCFNELLTDPPAFDGNELVLSEKPGIGTGINDAFVEQHPLPPEPNPNAI